VKVVFAIRNEEAAPRCWANKCRNWSLVLHRRHYSPPKCRKLHGQ